MLIVFFKRDSCYKRIDVVFVGTDIFEIPSLEVVFFSEISLEDFFVKDFCEHKGLLNFGWALYTFVVLL